MHTFPLHALPFTPVQIGAFPINLIILAANDDDDGSGGARANRMLRMLRVAKLTKLVRMLKLGTYLEYLEVLIKFNPGLLRIFKLCLISILCCHWFGCLWWLISDIEITVAEMQSPWEAGPNLWHPPPWLKYSTNFNLKYWHSFFWGAGMCMGMVPRDIEPVTSLEAIVTTFTMFIGLLLAAFVISSFTSAFASIDSKNALAGHQLDMIRNYLVLKAVPSDLRSRILEYYEYIFTSSQVHYLSLHTCLFTSVPARLSLHRSPLDTSSQSMDDLKLLQHMPPNLSAQLALSVNAKLISKCAFFHEVSNASLDALVSNMVPLVYVPGQILCTEALALRTVFFINRGKVQLLRRIGSEDETVIRTLSEADNIGLDDFARSMERTVALSARALTYCDVMSLSVDELSAAMEHDAAERLRREGERRARDLREEKERDERLANGGGSGKPDLSKCFRAAGNIARLRSRMGGFAAKASAAANAGASANTATSTNTGSGAPTAAWGDGGAGASGSASEGPSCDASPAGSGGGEGAGGEHGGRAAEGAADPAPVGDPVTKHDE